MTPREARVLPFRRLDSKSSLDLQLSRTSVAHKDAPTARWHLSRGTRVVTKKEIVKAISEEIGLTQLKTKEIVQKTFDAIVETLVREKRIELRNFGVFEVKRRAARKARNPRTGERVDVAEKFVVTFKPGKEMEEKVRLLEEEAAREAEARRRGEEYHSPLAPSEKPVPRHVVPEEPSESDREAARGGEHHGQQQTDLTERSTYDPSYVAGRYE